MLPCNLDCRDSSCQLAVRLSPSIRVPTAAPGQARQAAEDVYRTPLSPSVENLRHRQRQRIVIPAKRASRARLPTGKAISRRPPTKPLPRRTRRKVSRSGTGIRVHINTNRHFRKPLAFETPQLLKLETPRPSRLETHTQPVLRSNTGNRYSLLQVHTDSQDMYHRPPIIREPKLLMSTKTTGRSADKLEEYPARVVRKPNRPVPQPRPTRAVETTVAEVGSSSATPRQRSAPVPGTSKCSGAQCDHCGSAISNEKRFGIADPALWEAVRRSLSQQSRVSAVTSPTDVVSIPSGGPEPPSRTSSQRKAVDRFSRQLEKYAELRDAPGKLPIFTPTPDSVTSLHTVSALLPYEEEFQAAGLAVTSDQQRQRSPGKAKSRTDIAAMPPTDRANVGALQLDRLFGSSSSSSDSSSATEVAFARPEADWELYLIDELPPRKEKQATNFCKWPCFKDKPSAAGRESSTEDMAVPRVSGGSPSKPLEAWPDVRVVGDTGEEQRLQNKRYTRAVQVGTRPKMAEVLSSTKPLLQQKPKKESYAKGPKGETLNEVISACVEAETKPPIPPKAVGLRKARQTLPDSPEVIDYSKVKGLRKLQQTGVVEERFPRLDEMTPVIYSSPPNQVQQQCAMPTPLEPKPNAQPTIDEPPRKQLRLPRKQLRLPLPPKTPRINVIQREPGNTVMQGKQKETPFPPIFGSGRLHQNLPAPQKQPEMNAIDRPTIKARGTVSSTPDLPFTWRFSVSTPSSLERALEVAASELERTEKQEEGTELVKQIMKDNENDAGLENGENRAEICRDHHTSVSRRDRKEKANPPPKVPEHLARYSVAKSDSSAPVDYDDRDINDRDVLRGLHIAASAACDEEVDAFIRNKTGVRIRRFLADLKAFETLGEESPPDPTEQRARRRRAELRRMKQQVRQSMKARPQGL